MKNLKKYYKIKATPPEVYGALTNSLSIEIWTGEEAVMTTKAGDEFSLFGGDIVGRNLQFEPDNKLIQEWYFGDQPEPSIVTITLIPDKYFTKVELLHTNIPDEAFEDIIDGWDESYFKPLKDFFE